MRIQFGGGFYRGTFFAIIAAIFWGLGNVVTYYSAKQYGVVNPFRALLEIGICNYTGGCVAFLLIGFLRKKNEKNANKYINKPFYFSILSKYLNVLFFTGSVIYLAPEVAAVLENSYILIPSVILFVKLQRIVYLILGTTLIFCIYGIVHTEYSSHNENILLGSALAIGACLSFYVYLEQWSQYVSENKSNLYNATFVFTLSVLVTLLLTYAVLVVGVGGAGVLSYHDIWIQVFNGTYNIAGTYYCITLASKYLGKETIGVYVLSLCLAYSILFSYLIKLVVFDGDISLVVVLSSIGFAFVFAVLRKII